MLNYLVMLMGFPKCSSVHLWILKPTICGKTVCLSILELKGWEFQPSSRKFLELAVESEQLDFPGICCFLQSSLDLETLVIDWYNVAFGLLSRYTNEDEQTRRFESHNFNGSFPYLKTISKDLLVVLHVK
ncbi:uncharacterized protein [Solanum tuberosum]|uniref:uncharacterized protein n=1 Tax=Solanum tuberosum TaxID=4113 RepID=UPI00073A0612|nr:PREDICTED: uncharacterized protein LOC107061512 [Solanum tuberosum]